MGLRAIGMAALVGSLAFAAPNEAEACWPAIPVVDHTVPVDGGVHPANAAALVAGHVIDPEGLGVTVDGVSATVAIDARSRARDYWGWDFAYEVLVLQVEPPPQPGQSVHLFASELCLPEIEGEPECEPFDLQYTVGPAERESPEFEVDVWYDVYDHLSEETGHDTCWQVTARFAIDVEVEIEPLAEAPVFFQLLRRPRDAPDQWAPVASEWRLMPEGIDPRAFPFRYRLPDVAEVLPLAEAYCFELRTEDLAGNPGPSVQRCLPCRDQFGDGDNSFVIGDFPERVTYSNDWLYPGGYCPESILDMGEDEPPAADDTGGTDDTGPASGSSDGSETSDGAGTGGAGAGMSTEPAVCGCRTRPGPSLAWCGPWLGLMLMRRRRDRRAR